MHSIGIQVHSSILISKIERIGLKCIWLKICLSLSGATAVKNDLLGYTINMFNCKDSGMHVGVHRSFSVLWLDFKRRGMLEEMYQKPEIFYCMKVCSAFLQLLHAR